MPRRKKSTRGIFFSLILGIIIGLGCFYLWKNYQPEDYIPLVQNETEEIESGEIEEESKKEIPRPDIGRQEIMAYITKNIAILSPAEPVLGGKWHTINFWFADDYNFYADYEDGHILRRLLISVEGTTEAPEYKIVGYFEPGDDQWILKEGENAIFGKDLDLYGWDEEKREWIKFN